MSGRTGTHLAILCALTVALSGVPLGGAEPPTRDFSRYQIILDRAPFGKMGELPEDAQQPSFSTRFTFVGIASEGDDQPLLAIIQENDTKHVDFKAEGESIGAVKVVKIEKSENGPTKLVLKQDLEVATLMLEAKPGVGAARRLAGPGSARATTIADAHPTGCSPYSVSTGRISEKAEIEFIECSHIGMAGHPNGNPVTWRRVRRRRSQHGFPDRYRPGNGHRRDR